MSILNLVAVYMMYENTKRMTRAGAAGLARSTQGMGHVIPVKRLYNRQKNKDLLREFIDDWREETSLEGDSNG